MQSLFVELSHRSEPFREDRSSLLHRRTHHTETVDPAGDEDTREGKSVRRGRTPARSHTAELQKQQ